MKATDFRPEHFEKGQSFDREVFREYTEASADLAKGVYTGYLPCVAAGLLIALLLSKGVGGFAGNILAVVSCFAGLIAGGLVSGRKGRRVNELASRLGITKADVAAARRHVQNGTVAWTGGEELRTEKTAEPAGRMHTGGGEARPEPEKPARALWAALLLAAGWLLLAGSFIVFTVNLSPSIYPFYVLTGAALGASAYLVYRGSAGLKIAGAALGLASGFLYADTAYGIQRLLSMAKHPTPGTLFPLRDPMFFRVLWRRGMLPAILCLAAALLLSFLRKRKDKAGARFCGLFSAAVFFASCVGLQYGQLRYSLGKNGPAGQLFNQLILPALLAAVALYAAFTLVRALCGMFSARVRLRGIGLVWAWIALLGGAAVIALCVYVGSVGPKAAGTRVYSFQLITGISALTGYLMLLCRRRAGLWFILLGAGLMLLVQLTSGLMAIRMGSPVGAALRQQIVPAVLGALNPLFAALAVRAGETPEE